MQAKVKTHGIFWFTGNKEMPPCPDCMKQQHFIEVRTEHRLEGDDVQIAECTCHACGCVFTLEKKE